MPNNLFSKQIQAQLKQLKTELAKGRSSDDRTDENGKPTDNVALPSKQQVAKQVKKYDSEHLDDDKLLFMQAMSGVRPIKDKNLANKAKPSQKPDATTLAKRASAQGNDDSPSHQLSDMQALLNPVSGDTYLSYKVPTLQNKVFNELKQGKIRWHDAVDLHGSSIEEAREAVSQLISQARKNNETSVKIIHGKGTDSILKTCVNGWLRQIPEVLAFCSAPTPQGGNGAVLVLLKKSETAKNV
ncbi:Smr/MutS family protein [Faucicola boevrei]|uniref:Smr/MutS family protein n=1 Tax=Faucicola boevrei TaxID=346665 RepID=UPI00035C2B02|nr:Smr/MutS family protein [Moraxella boevrei]